MNLNLMSFVTHTYRFTISNYEEREAENNTERHLALFHI